MSVQGIATLLNTYSEGMFGVLLLVVVFFIIFIRNRNTHPTHEAIMGGMHAVAILSLPLLFMGLLTNTIAGIIWVGWAGSIILLANRE